MRQQQQQKTVGKNMKKQGKNGKKTGKNRNKNRKLQEIQKRDKTRFWQDTISLRQYFSFVYFSAFFGKRTTSIKTKISVIVSQ